MNKSLKAVKAANCHLFEASNALASAWHEMREISVDIADLPRLKAAHVRMNELLTEVGNLEFQFREATAKAK